MSARPANWYRNIGGVYHRATRDWVRTGRAICGADISRPAFVAYGYEKPKLSCAHCRRKEASEEPKGNGREQAS